MPLDKLPEPHRKLAEVIGVEAMMRFCETYGGMSFTVPKMDKILAAERNGHIRREYNGYNASALARKYGLSKRMIEMIVDGSAPAQIDGQMGIDEYLSK
jgi:Mor family transcriptional regulator